MISVELAVLILTFGEVVWNPVFETTEVNELDGSCTFTQTHKRIGLVVVATETNPAAVAVWAIWVQAL